MKMVAAAKLKRAQDNAEKSRPYANKMKDIVFSLISRSSTNNIKFSKTNNKKTVLLIILMILYGITILRAGYFLSTSIFLVLSYLVLGERKWRWIFTLSFPFVALFMYLLHGLLNIYLRDPFLQYLGIMG